MMQSLKEKTKMIKNIEEKRVSVKLNCPNPLFERWLEEWRIQAIDKELKSQNSYSLALKSLRKYPLPLETGRDCKILKGFGNQICRMLDDALKKHNMGENVCLKAKKNATKNAVLNTGTKEKRRGNEDATKKRKSDLSNYIPMYKSGPYALILTLYKASLNEHYQGFMLKNDLIRAAQPLCDVSFTKPEPGTYYTSWNSMKTLINKNLVHKESNPAKFSLTVAGNLLGSKLYNQASDDDNCSGPMAKHTKKAICQDNSLEKIQSVVDSNEKFYDPPASGSCGEQNLNTKKNTKGTVDYEDVIFAPHSFDVVLYVDTQETKGAVDSQDNAMLAYLSHLNVNYEVKNLKVGDYCWICRDRLSKEELVMPYIIERKRMDDLASSIKDGRYYEQKFRLKRCGLRNVIYMVETFGTKDVHVGLPLSSLYQATVNTLIQDGFVLKFVDGTKGVAEYLACMSNLLREKFENKTLVSSPRENISDTSVTDDLVSLMYFREFKKLSSKTKKFTVKEMFIKLLLRIKGVSIAKAMAIVDVYCTPQALRQAFDENRSKSVNLISNIKYGKLNKKIGPHLGNVIYLLFMNEKF